MEYYTEQFKKMKLIFSEEDNFSWNINSNKFLILYKDQKPFGKFSIKIVAKIINNI